MKKEIPLDGFFFIRVGKFAENERDIPILQAQEALCQEEESYPELKE